MKKIFAPDFYFSAYSQVTPEFLHTHGIRAMILDIDNTLLPYEIPDPTEALYAWFAEMTAAGIRFAFVSNNDQARVDRVNQKLGFAAFAKSKKPLPNTMKRALAALEACAQETAVIGDQVFTDMLAGNCMGCLTILVPPIRDKTDPLTKCKRLLEKPILSSYFKRSKQ